MYLLMQGIRGTQSVNEKRIQEFKVNPNKEESIKNTKRHFGPLKMKMMSASRWKIVFHAEITQLLSPVTTFAPQTRVSKIFFIYNNIKY